MNDEKNLFHLPILIYKIYAFIFIIGNLFTLKKKDVQKLIET